MKERKFDNDIYMKFNITMKINEPKAVTFSLNNYQNQEEKLIGYKSFLEKILGLIKNSQKNLILKKNLKNRILSSIKQVLIVLQNNLTLIKVNKDKTLKLLEAINNQKRDNFFKLKNSNKSLYHPFKNNLQKNFDSLIKETIENESHAEISQLKNLNFEVENEIQKIENIKKRMILEINYYNMSRNFQETAKVNYINKIGNDNEMINQLLHNKLIDKRNEFVNLANMRNKQEDEINITMDNINFYKFKLKTEHEGKKKIIRLNKQFYIETIKEDTENDEISINQNNSFEFDNFYVYNGIIKDEDDLIKNNNSNKDSTCNEETNCNSSSKKESI